MSSEIVHRRVHTNGIWIHFAEKGKGPLVLLIHGFPELWSSWKHQITHLSEHGYRVVAPDMRGYGDSDCPRDPASYTAFVVGHDWGALVAWYLCLFRPDRVKALVNLGVPYKPNSPMKPTEFFNKTFGDGFYISQFQESGRTEKSFSQYNCLTILKKLLLIDGPDLLAAPPGVEIVDFLDTPSSLPAWITEDELKLRASKFKKSGFTGALNYYRAMDINWELLGPWQGAKIKVPTKFIVGNKDVGFQSFGTKDYIEGEECKNYVPDMEVVIVDDGHHYIQEEKAELVNNHILSFFNN
ncbi:hypothetical protein ACSBR1_020040 [Camellia fascicularis]